LDSKIRSKIAQLESFFWGTKKQYFLGELNRYVLCVIFIYVMCNICNITINSNSIPSPLHTHLVHIQSKYQWYNVKTWLFLGHFSTLQKCKNIFGTTLSIAKIVWRQKPNLHSNIILSILMGNYLFWTFKLSNLFWGHFCIVQMVIRVTANL